MGAGAATARAASLFAEWGATARWKARGGLTGPCLHAGWVAGGWRSPVRKLQEVDGG
jgi:hypothetical protein